MRKIDRIFNGFGIVIYTEYYKHIMNYDIPFINREAFPNVILSSDLTEHFYKISRGNLDEVRHSSV